MKSALKIIAGIKNKIKSMSEKKYYYFSFSFVGEGGGYCDDTLHSETYMINKHTITHIKEHLKDMYGYKTLVMLNVSYLGRMTKKDWYWVHTIGKMKEKIE